MINNLYIANTDERTYVLQYVGEGNPAIVKVDVVDEENASEIVAEASEEEVVFLKNVQNNREYYGYHVNGQVEVIINGAVAYIDINKPFVDAAGKRNA